MIRHFVQPDPAASTDPGAQGMFVGRLSRDKGLGTLLEALSEVGDPPFLVAGEGPAKDDLMNTARSIGLENVRFLGWQEPTRVRELIRRSRYHVVPSLWEETANLGAMEALAAGRPVIASDIGAVPELVRGGAGFVVKPGDSQALAASIRRLLKGDELCREMGRKALAFAHAHLTPERHLASLEDAYAAVGA
jgi:glycosyltransferase involved in cell wall biosynthesis